MAGVMAFAAFLGTWLLVAGPVFQAALELHDEEFPRDQFDATVDSIPTPPPISAWWWLLPPVLYVKQRRRDREYRRAVAAALPPEDMRAFFHYANKVYGWMLVGAGALLLAVDETWNLRVHYEWPTALFWILTVVMVALVLLHTVFQVIRGRRILGEDSRRG